VVNRREPAPHGEPVSPRPDVRLDGDEIVADADDGDAGRATRTYISPRSPPTVCLYGSGMTMTGADVVEILGWLDAASADVWLDGGWGVDALVGEQTREHQDLDLIVRDAHVSRMREALATHGFAQIEGGIPQSFILADERGREVDVHPVRFDDQGGGHLLSAEGEPFGHSIEAFAATGSVSGYRVPCLSAEAQMSNHSWGYEPGDTDVHDMRLLHDRLGTPLTTPYQSV
jgi:lincosamide nucleotidyltransferase A/C/D/E